MVYSLLYSSQEKQFKQLQDILQRAITSAWSATKRTVGWNLKYKRVEYWNEFLIYLNKTEPAQELHESQFWLRLSFDSIITIVTRIKQVVFGKQNVITQKLALPNFLLYKESLVNQSWNCPCKQRQAVHMKAISVRIGYVTDVINKHPLCGMGSGSPHCLYTTIWLITLERSPGLLDPHRFFSWLISDSSLWKTSGLEMSIELWGSTKTTSYFLQI